MVGVLRIRQVDFDMELDMDLHDKGLYHRVLESSFQVYHL